MEDDLCLFYFWISVYCIKEDIKREKKKHFPLGIALIT